MLELNYFLAQVPLPLDAQRAARLVQQFTIKRLRQRTRSLHHQVKCLDAVNWSGYDEEQTDTGDLLIFDIRQIKTTRFNEAGGAKNRTAFIITVITMKNTELAMP
jgi:hypothetical protein